MAPPRKGAAAIAATQGHLGGEGGEGGREPYTLTAAQIGQLQDARGAPKDQRETEETAFWRAAADTGGFLYNTAELAEDWEESGAFTAWPATQQEGEEPIDLSEGAHTLAIERMEALAVEAVLNDRSLVQDVRDFLLDQIKARPKPWGATSNAEQRDVASACENSAQELVRKIVEAIAAHGREPIRALLVSYGDKGELEVKLKVKAFTPAESEKAVIGLHRAVGKNVLITVASVDDHSEAREAETDADEPGLSFDSD